MRPIQVWLPTINSSWADPVFELDIQRAFQEWSGEQTVWFVPTIEKPYRWKEGQNPWDWILAVPAGRWERVDVYHVNERGHVSGLCAGARFPNGSIDGLLEIWLNVLKNHGCYFYLAPSTLTWKQPSILELPPTKEGEERIGVKYTETTFSLHPCDMIAFKKIGAIDEGKILVEAVWPPAGQPRPTISMARESQMYFGPLEGYEQDGLRLVRHGDNPDSPGIHLVLRWDEPLQSLFPIGADNDTLLHQGKMVYIALQSAENRQDAMHRAQSTIGMYVTPGWARWDALWLWPAVARYGPERGIEEARTKARRRSLSVQEFGTEAWQEQLRKRVDVSRAWGPIGLFWALLVEHLEQGLRLSECEHCHRLNSGKKGKRFCGPDDDPACYAQRRARDKRKERAR